MTLVLALLRRGPRQFVRLSRGQLEAQVDALEVQRDRALGEARATRDWVASWLTGRADAYRADATRLDRPGVKPHGDLTAEQRRAVAHELDQIVIDLDHGAVLDRGRGATR